MFLFILKNTSAKRLQIFGLSNLKFLNKMFRFDTNSGVLTPPVVTKRTVVGALCANVTACLHLSWHLSISQRLTPINGDFSPISTGTLIVSEITEIRPTGIVVGTG